MTDFIDNINGQSLMSSAFDGKKVAKLFAVFQDVTFTADQYKTYSLESVIPHDGFDYDVEFEGFITTGTSSGNAAGMTLYGGTTSSDTSGICRVRCCRCVTRASSNQISSGTAIVTIRGKDRFVTVRNQDASGTSGNCSLYVKRYIRKLGFNQRSSNTKYISKINRGNNNENLIGGEMLDGQWVRSTATLASGVSLAAGVATSYSVANYLPSDGYDYEVLAVLTGRTGTTSGNSVTLRIGTETTANNNSRASQRSSARK